jgi:hypothetical protein
MITQLNPTLPVIVTSKDNRHGEVFALWNRSPEHDIYYGVIMDDTGEIWWVPNPEVRVTFCWTVGRPPRPTK